MASLGACVTPLCPAGHLPHKGGEPVAAAVAMRLWGFDVRLAKRQRPHSPPLWGRYQEVTEGGNRTPVRSVV